MILYLTPLLFLSARPKKPLSFILVQLNLKPLVFLVFAQSSNLQVITLLVSQTKSMSL